MKELNGSSFKLRKWTDNDVESLVRHANNQRIAENLRDGFPYPYSMSDAKEWIRMVIANKHDVIYAIETEGEAVGGIGLHGMKDVYRYNAEIGYWLSEKYWGRGIVTESVSLLVDLAFTNYSWTRIYAGVFSNNSPSMRVLEKCGFTREAIFKNSVRKSGKVLDEHVYSILKDNWNNNNR